VPARLRIGMLLGQPFPPDPRVEQEARSLAGAGHRVHLFCIDWMGRPRREEADGLVVHRYPIPRWFHRKLGALVGRLPFYEAWYRRRLPGFLRAERIQVLHVHDLPLAHVALAAAAAAGIPCVLDLHENFPAALRTYAYAQSRLGRLLIDPERWEARERDAVARADLVVVVVEEARERIAALGVPPERIVVVPNTVDLERFLSLPVREEIVQRLAPGPLRLLYTGGFDAHRGLDVAVEALGRARARGVDAELVLVGTGRNRPELERLVRRRGLERHVRFEGWRPPETLPTYIRLADVGLVPHRRSPHTDATIPHKLFHYMALARPVLTTDCRPLRRIVEETGCGLVVPDGDAEAMAEAVSALRDPDLRRRLGHAGQRAVAERYRWDRTVAPLLEAYARLARRVEN
jgi:glycosyltransferase involved in cell wall biosynthesis